MAGHLWRSKRPRERPRQRYRERISKDVSKLRMNNGNELARNRDDWRQVAVTAMYVNDPWKPRGNRSNHFLKNANNNP